MFFFWAVIHLDRVTMALPFVEYAWKAYHLPCHVPRHFRSPPKSVRSGYVSNYPGKLRLNVKKLLYVPYSENICMYA